MLEIQKILKDWRDDRKILAERNTVPNLIEMLDAELKEFRADPNRTELADLGIVILNIALEMGLDLEAEIREKIALNTLRFPPPIFSSGDYDSARKACKSVENPIIESFYSVKPE